MNRAPAAYAGIVSRGAAFFIDAAGTVLVCTVGFQLTMAVLSTVGVTKWSSGEGSSAIGYVLAIPIVFWIYCAGFWSLVGRTPGMMLLGVRVVTVNGEPPGIGRSSIRALGYWISAILMLGFAWIAVDERRQGFHDKLARTFVVYDRDVTAR
jgi:uncharacterized RDD family membrane protein YckC